MDIPDLTKTDETSKSFPPRVRKVELAEVVGDIGVYKVELVWQWDQESSTKVLLPNLIASQRDRMVKAMSKGGRPFRHEEQPNVDVQMTIGLMVNGAVIPLEMLKGKSVVVRKVKLSASEKKAELLYQLAVRSGRRAAGEMYDLFKSDVHIASVVNETLLSSAESPEGEVIGEGEDDVELFGVEDGPSRQARNRDDIVVEDTPPPF